MVDVVLFEVGGLIRDSVDSGNIVDGLGGLSEGSFSDSGVLGRMLSFLEDGLFFLFGFEGDFECLEGELALFGDGHVVGWGGEGLSEFMGVV